MSLSWKRPDPLGDVASFRVTRTDSQGSASVDVPVDTSTREDGHARVGETVAWSVVGVDAAGATTAAATATLPVDGSSVAQVHVVERLDIDAFALGPGGLVFAGAVEDTITSGPFSYTRADAVDYVVVAGGPAPRLIGRFTADSDDDTVYAVATEVDRASGDVLAVVRFAGDGAHAVHGTTGSATVPSADAVLVLARFSSTGALRWTLPLIHTGEIAEADLAIGPNGEAWWTFAFGSDFSDRFEVTLPTAVAGSASRSAVGDDDDFWAGFVARVDAGGALQAGDIVWHEDNTYAHDVLVDGDSALVTRDDGLNGGIDRLSVSGSHVSASTVHVIDGATSLQLLRHPGGLLAFGDGSRAVKLDGVDHLPALDDDTRGFLINLETARVVELHASASDGGTMDLSFDAAMFNDGRIGLVGRAQRLYGFNEPREEVTVTLSLGGRALSVERADLGYVAILDAVKGETVSTLLPITGAKPWQALADDRLYLCGGLRSDGEGVQLLDVELAPSADTSLPAVIDAYALEVTTR